MRFTALLILLISYNVYSQESYFLLNSESSRLLQRYEVATGKFSPSFFSDVQPYRRSHAQTFIETLSPDSFTGKTNAFNLEYLKYENLPYSGGSYSSSKKPIFKTFYKDKANFFTVNEPAFKLFVNPVLNFSGGRELESDRTIFQNTRGVEIRGTIDNKVGFYTLATDNQIKFPDYIDTFIADKAAIPNIGFYKPFKDGGGYDFFQARGYFTFNATKHIQLQFGHDRNFIGNGMRSLLLSDFSPNYLFLKIKTQIWKIQYQNLFAEFIYGDDFTLEGEAFQKKYGAFHYLTINILKNLRLGLFEGIIYHSDNGRCFEFNYLNPIIFYRSVEHNLGSPDNALVGTNISFIPYRNIMVYTQLLFDEFKLSEFRDNPGWWANKYGFQGGFKYVNAFTLQNLDLQGEFNMVRPYTYGHKSTASNYSHFGQPLAHPLGANFREFIFKASYQFSKRFYATVTVMSAKYGADTAGSNWGGDINLSYSHRTSNPNNNSIGQGVQQDILFAKGQISYQLRHNLFIDLEGGQRMSNSEIDLFNYNSTFLSVGLRLNDFSKLPVF